jgi:hypothetical protein
VYCAVRTFRNESRQPGSQALTSKIGAWASPGMEYGPTALPAIERREI